MGPRGMPVPLTRFVGRERELAVVRRTLGQARLVTLTGAGGAGKTRLSLAAVADGHPDDAAWWVDLGGVADGMLVPQTVATALGVRERAGHQLVAEVADRVVDAATLLVLDSCEHLLAACAELVGELLTRCPRLTVLATSRATLGLAGEHTLAVPPLAVPDPGNLPPVAGLTRYEGVALFVDRARLVDPGFALDEDNARHVAEICRRLDGLPLAIELAAARTQVLSVGEIAHRLADSFAVLTGGSRAVPPRHRTLRAAIEWSHDLLDPPQLVLLRRLSVFAGGFTLEAAEAVCADGPAGADVLDLLAALVDQSLVVVVARSDRTRYRLLDPVRHYAHERLEESGEATTVRRRHAEEAARLAEATEPRLRSADRGVAIAALDVEIANLREALAWSLGTDDGLGTGLGRRLAAALMYYWWFHGFVAEGQRLLGAAAPPAGEECSALDALVLSGHGMLTWAGGDAPAGLEVLRRAVALWRSLDEPMGLAEALRFLSLGQESVGDLAAARATIEESVALFRTGEDPFGLAMSLGRLGITAIGQGDLGIAAAVLDEAAQRCRAAGDAWVLALVLRHRGIGALRENDGAAAVAALTEGLRLLRGQAEGVLAVGCLETLAATFAAGGDPVRAARLFGAAEAARSVTGMSVTYPADLERGTRLARAALGPEAADREWERGRALTLDEAVDLAVEPAVASAASSTPLTDREAEILGLVALGLTNAQVAAELYLSARTVNWHLTSVYAKFGVGSRTQAVRYALDHGFVRLS